MIKIEIFFYGNFITLYDPKFFTEHANLTFLPGSGEKKDFSHYLIEI